MNILTAVICCPFKNYSLKECLTSIREAGLTDVLLNYEGIIPEDLDYDYKQEWFADGDGFHDREYDQDQRARLTRICIARNMVMDFMQQSTYEWLLFVDSDVIIPKNTLDLFTPEKNYLIRGGWVGGRGAHSGAQYLFYPHEIDGFWQRVDYSTCGFLAIHKSIVPKIRFRWGEPIEGGPIASEDPLFGSDTRNLLKIDWWVKLDLKAKHFGDFIAEEAARF